MATAASTPKEQSGSEIAADSLLAGVAFALVLTVVQRLVGFVRNILFCRYMSDEQLGQWSLIYSFVFMLAPLAVLGLPGCFGRFVEHYHRRKQLSTFLTRISWICGITTAALAVGLLAFPDSLSWAIFRETGHTTIVYAVVLTLVGVAVINYLTSLLEAMRQIRIVTLMRFMSTMLFTLFALAFLGTWENGTLAVTLGLGIGSIIACLPAFWFLNKNRLSIESKGEALTHKTMWVRIAPYAAWMWMCNLLHNTIEVADRYMLIHWSPVTPEQAQSYVGQYHSGRVIPIVLIGVATMLGGVLMPYMTAYWERGEIKKAHIQINWTNKLIALSFTLIGAGVLVFSPLLFDVVLQGRYQDGLAVLPLALMYCVWFSVFVVAQDFLWVAEKGKFGVLAAAIGLAFNILLNAILIPRYGLWGAVWATSIANGVALIMIFAFNHIYGAKPDLGCWLSAAAPLTLLLPIHYCLAAITLLIILAGTTSLIFSNEEKEQTEKVLSKLRERILPS